MDASHKYESGKTPQRFLHAIVKWKLCEFFDKAKMDEKSNQFGQFCLWWEKRIEEADNS